MVLPVDNHRSQDSSPDGRLSSSTLPSAFRDDERRYLSFLNNTFHCVVTDLDGVMYQKGRPHAGALQALFDATIGNASGKVPLIVATGRSADMVQTMLLPEIFNYCQDRNVGYSEGDVVIFASNGAYAFDAASGRVLISDPLTRTELVKLVKLDTVKTLLLLRSLFQKLPGGSQNPSPRFALDPTCHTLLVGVHPEAIDDIAAFSKRGEEVSRHFKTLFGPDPTGVEMVAVINRELAASGIPLEAWTSSGAHFIGFHRTGVSKRTAIEFAMAMLESRGVEVNEAMILSIGDSPDGNDHPLVQRKGGICNLERSEVPESVVVIKEDGDQWERVTKLLKQASIVCPV